MGFQEISVFALFLLCSVFALSHGFSRNLPILSFDEGYSQLFGDDNLIVLKDGKSVHLSLNERTGSGFVSQDLYLHGFFSASIKLPADYTAGVVVAFYMSNGDIFEKNHDEIDFEFLGNIRGKEWRIQTNIYGNGSTKVGREERYGLWFDPTDDFHQYSILWTHTHIMFYGLLRSLRWHDYHNMFRTFLDDDDDECDLVCHGVSSTLWVAMEPVEILKWSTL